MAARWRPVSSLSSGFLSLIGVKNQGKAPDVLDDTLQPVIDMGEWYKGANSVNRYVIETGFVVQLSGILIPTPAAGAIEVPDGQVWWIHEVTFGLQAGAAGDNLEGYGVASAAAFLPGNPQHNMVGPMVDWVSIGSPIAGVVGHAPSLRDFLAPPGTTFGGAATMAYNSNGGAPAAFSTFVSVRYTPMTA